MKLLPVKSKQLKKTKPKKWLYRCKECGKIYDHMEKAKDCEESH